MSEIKENVVIIFDYHKYDEFVELFKNHDIWTKQEIQYILLEWFNKNGKNINQTQINKMLELIN